MNENWLLGKGWAALFALVACSVTLSASAATLNESGVRPTAGGTYYTIRPDLRRCISPLCGGYWISAVNQQRTQCADGSMQQQCYVSDIDWQALGLSGSEGATLVRGTLRLEKFSGFGSFGVLVPHDAWRPASDAAPAGVWFAVNDNGIRCITYPCYSIDERVLNRKRTQTISAVDLDGVAATDADRKAAMDALANDELIAVGKNVVIPNEGPAGDGLTLVATQFFLRVTQAVDTSLFCSTSRECTLSPYHSYVRSPDECYCPLCPVPMNVEAAATNQASWERHCTNFGYSSRGNVARLACPMVLCIAPDPVGCVDNQCAFLEGSTWPLLLQ